MQLSNKATRTTCLRRVDVNRQAVVARICPK